MSLKLLPYQKIGAEFLASRKRAALFDEMGCGKTSQALAACELVKASRVLVICQASLRLNILNECEMWETSFTPEVVSFHHLQKEANARKLAATAWDVCIVDESQNFKNWAAKQTRNFIKIVAKSCRRIWLLTGTPAVQSAADYHPQLSILLPGKLGKFGDWKERYCNLHEVGYGRYARQVWSGFKRPHEINEIVSKVSLRRTLAEVNKELPEVIYQDLSLDIDYDIPELEEDELDELIEEEDRPPESITPYLRELGILKAKEALDFLHGCPSPTVIWVMHTDTKDFLLEHLEGKVLPLSGKESAVKKQKAVDLLQAGKLDYLVANILAGGVGHTFTRSSTTVFIEFPWSAAQYMQAVARLRRHGQTRPVHVVNCKSESSLDNRLLKKISGKARGMSKCLAKKI